jgi:hypothetical protein
MKAKGIVVRLALTGAGALLSFAAAAQMYRPEAFEEAPSPNEPALVLGLSPNGIDAVNREFAREARLLDLVRGKVGADRLAEISAERPEPWILYARLYVLNFRNNLGEQKLTESQIGFGRTGPAIAGRIYIGIRKRF